MCAEILKLHFQLKSYTPVYQLLLSTAVAPYKEHFMHSIAQLPLVGQGFFIIALGRTPQDKHSARNRDLYLTTQNTLTRQTSMHPAGFEHSIQQAIGRRPTP